MPPDARAAQWQSILRQLSEQGGAMERTAIYPGAEVINAAYTATRILVRGRDGYYEPALVMAGAIYNNGDLVSVLYIMGTEPIVIGQSPTSATAHPPGHIIQDEAVDLAQRPRLNFVGAGVTATDDAVNGQTDVTIPGGGGGWPLSIITVDENDADADYTGATALEDAFAGEVDGTFFTLGGPAIYVTTSSPLPDTSFLHSYGANDSLKVQGYIVGGIKYGLILEGNGYLRGIYAEGVDALGGDVGGVRIPNNATAQLDHCILHANGAFGATNGYAIDIGTNAVVEVYGGKLLSNDSTNRYGARVGAGSTLYLWDMPVIDAVTFFTGAGTIVGNFQDVNGDVWTVNGAAGSERRINSYLQASDGAPDPAWSVGATGNLAAAGAYSLDVNAGEIILDADADTSITADTDDQIDFRVNAVDEMFLTSAGLSAQNHAFRVKNTSGGAVGVYQLGYIDENGEFKTTTTAYADVAWCVVVRQGNNNDDCYVARRGRVTVYLNGNCSAGDYLYTSTTAGQAQPQAYMRPEVFAVALTANAGGAGGTCSALLLCERRHVPMTSTLDVYGILIMSSSDFRATINGAPAGASVVYNAPSSGAENTIVPDSNDNLGKIRLYNETRGDYALIDDVNVGTNTITLTAAAPGAWADTDVITTRSQTCTFAGPPYFYDLDFSSADNTIIPELAVKLEFEMLALDTGGAGAYQVVHPWEAFAGSKTFNNRIYIANTNHAKLQTIPLIQRRFCIWVNATGAGTFTYYFHLAGYWVAAP